MTANHVTVGRHVSETGKTGWRWICHTCPPVRPGPRGIGGRPRGGFHWDDRFVICAADGRMPCPACASDYGPTMTLGDLGTFHDGYLPGAPLLVGVCLDCGHCVEPTRLLVTA